jgi:voltage-gated potassium channel
MECNVNAIRRSSIMVTFLIGFMFVFRILREALKDPAFRALSMVVVLVLLIGTTFYTVVEDWSILDSLYFSVITLTTVGYGDFTPESTFGKIFTILYIFFGLGFLLAFVTTIAQRSRIWAQIEPDSTSASPDVGEE